MRSHDYTIHIKLVGMAALWGASWPWGRIAAQAMPPLSAAAVRFVLASVVLLLFLHGSGRLEEVRRITLRQWRALCCASAVGILGYSMFFFAALKSVPAGRAAVVVALNPVLTLLFATLLFREAVNRAMCFGVVLAVIGALYALSEGSVNAMARSPAEAGELLLLGCAACWVGYALIGKLILSSVDSFTTTTLTAVIGAVFLSSASLVLEGPSGWRHMLEAPAEAWWSILALAVGATALAYAWYLNGVQLLGATTATAYMSLVPVFGMVLSSLWLGEPLTDSLLIGGALAILGMVLMNRGRGRLLAAAQRTSAE
nr:DMT family transporter [uncultured Acidovorax sp.]